MSYGNASTDRDDYEEKRVLVIGRGNAAFEFAHHVHEVAEYVHVLGRVGKR
jgi:cation diffusion facilitator CzcD-associated flavoprotein CzcO